MLPLNLEPVLTAEEVEYREKVKPITNHLKNKQ